MSADQVVGFHSTSLAASSRIEKVGFFPNKIFDEADHSRLIAIAKTHGVKTFDYENWLSMRSVTFTIKPGDAIKHIRHGKAGGQGLKNICHILEQLPETTDVGDQSFLTEIESQIDAIRKDQAVTYAVDLSSLGPRLDKDKVQPFFYYRWHPNEALPEISEIAPTRILMKLVHKPSLGGN
jgi:hypothetical protein